MITLCCGCGKKALVLNARTLVYSCHLCRQTCTREEHPHD